MRGDWGRRAQNSPSPRGRGVDGVCEGSVAIASRVAGHSKTAGGCESPSPDHGRPIKVLVPSLMLNGEGTTGTGGGSHPHGAGWTGRRQAAALVGLRRSFARMGSERDLEWAV